MDLLCMCWVAGSLVCRASQMHCVGTSRICARLIRHFSAANPHPVSPTPKNGAHQVASTGHHRECVWVWTGLQASWPGEGEF